MTILRTVEREITIVTSHSLQVVSTCLSDIKAVVQIAAFCLRLRMGTAKTNGPKSELLSE